MSETPREFEPSSIVEELETNPEEKLRQEVAARQILSEINAIEAGREVKSLSVVELKKVRDKYKELKKALGIEQKGETVEFDFEKLKQYWVAFYRESNLPECADEVEAMEISLTKEQQERMQELAETEGFDTVILLPGNAVLQRDSAKIKQATEQEMAGLEKKNQYAKDGTFLSETVGSAFPDKIKNNNRPDKPYILFCKDTPEVDEETRKIITGTEDEKNSGQNLREHFKKQGKNGFTLQEYMIFQRDFTTRHKEMADSHPDTKYSTWLLDSELAPDSSVPFRVLGACWDPDGRRVRVRSSPPDRSSPSVGARSSAIFEIL